MTADDELGLHKGADVGGDDGDAVDDAFLMECHRLAKLHYGMRASVDRIVIDDPIIFTSPSCWPILILNMGWTPESFLSESPRSPRHQFERNFKPFARRYLLGLNKSERFEYSGYLSDAFYSICMAILGLLTIDTMDAHWLYESLRCMLEFLGAEVDYQTGKGLGAKNARRLASINNILRVSVLYGGSSRSSHGYDDDPWRASDDDEEPQRARRRSDQGQRSDGHRAVGKKIHYRGNRGGRGRAQGTRQQGLADLQSKAKAAVVPPSTINPSELVRADGDAAASPAPARKGGKKRS
jgi:hypothetical protein